MTQTKAQLIDGKSAEIEFAGGSASAPAISFTGDANTGIYSPGADQVAISTSGTGRLFVDSSGRVGLGTSSPSEILEAVGTIRSTRTGSSGYYFRGYRSSSTSSFYIYDDGTNIQLTNEQAGALKFHTQNTERLRIDSSGRVGIGTSGPTGLLDIRVNVSPQKDIIAGFTAGSPMFTYRNGSGTWFHAGKHPTEEGFVLTAGATTTSNELLRVDGSGNVGVGTTSPGAILEVAAASGQRHLRVITNSSADSCLQSVYPANGNLRPVSLDGSLIGFRTGSDGGTTSAEVARIDSSGRLLVGTSSARSPLGITPKIQVEGTDAEASLSLIRNTNSSANPYLVFAKSRGSSVGSATIVQNNDYLGGIYFNGADGTDITSSAAAIQALVDGTPGANDMPGRLVFSTTADGASSPTPRLTLSQAGTLYPNTDNAVQLGGSSYRYTALYAVNGTIQTSDAREKTSISDSMLGSDFIRSLRPVSYQWINGGNTPQTDSDGVTTVVGTPGVRTHWGFIAQEVKQAVDDAGVDFGGWVLDDANDPNSVQGLRYDQFIAPLTKALQEALEKIETLEAKVAALESA